MKAPKNAKNPLWGFSLTLYPKTGVKQACLALQTSLGVDINLILYSCWVGADGQKTLSTDDMQRVLEEVAPWHEDVVKGLRKVRQLLKDGYDPVSLERTDAIRKNILNTELEAEWIEQNLLFAVFESREAANGVAGWEVSALNISLYLSALGIRPDANDQKNLATIIGNAFPKTPDEAIDLRLQGLFA